MALCTGDDVKTQTGATLVELIVSIVIIATVSTSAMMLVAQTTGRSADPLIRIQSIAIAEAFMEEVFSQAYPDAGDTGFESGETRATFDDIADYNGYTNTNGLLDQNGALITGLDAYTVTVSVGDPPVPLPNGVPSRLIQVSVSHISNPAVVYRLVAHRVQ